MATVVYEIDTDNPPKPTEDSIARMAALKDRPIDYSDIPELTDEDLADLKRQLKEGKNKQMFSLRLKQPTIEWWKNCLGIGYTTAMGQLLDEARNHPEWIKESLKKR